MPLLQPYGHEARSHSSSDTVSTQPAPSATEASPPGAAWLKRAGTAILNLVFPPTCVACQRYGAWLCSACADVIERLEPPLCARCGWPGHQVPPPSGRASGCCPATLDSLDGLRALAFHSGPLRTAIHQLKYGDLRALAGSLADLMAEGWPALAPEGTGFDTLVPIPLHRARQRERGYNQAALLARELGARLQRPVIESGLERIRDTAPQVGLKPAARRQNVRNAFRCRGGHFEGQRVLLIDDVCTTGATLEAAATALRAGGAVSVWAYTLARARGQSGPVSQEPL